jgi:hypothetical protein
VPLHSVARILARHLSGYYLSNMRQTACGIYRTHDGQQFRKHLLAKGCVYPFMSCRNPMCPCMPPDSSACSHGRCVFIHPCAHGRASVSLAAVDTCVPEVLGYTSMDPDLPGLAQACAPTVRRNSVELIARSLSLHMYTSYARIYITVRYLDISVHGTSLCSLCPINSELDERGREREVGRILQSTGQHCSHGPLHAGATHPVRSQQGQSWSPAW